MKKFLITALCAIAIASSTVSLASAAEISKVETSSTPNSRILRGWSQYVPKVNASSLSDEIILFYPTKSTITFQVEGLTNITSVNIAVVGLWYGDWGTVVKGDKITFTGLTPGQPYNAKFSSYSGSGTARLLMDY